MAEYINREALIAEYDRVHIGEAGGARKLMVEAPAADVVEVVHACWQWSKVNGQYGYYCSNCRAGWANSENAEWIAKSHDYCPKCGAKMDAERRSDE
jgi:DNA-directed RNA polymerase subunit RPC12/RpoP